MSDRAYKLLDSGNQLKLEQVGPFKLKRPCAQAVWSPRKPKLWNEVDLSFSREKKSGWAQSKKIEPSWLVSYKSLTFKVSPTSFGHLGIFPEHLDQYESLDLRASEGSKILNLFAYTGAASIYFAKQGAKVTHLDASKTSVSWAKENAKLNHLEDQEIRWIVDDALKFLKRELKRGVVYDAIILDPPSFGKGSSSQIFKIEKDIHLLLSLCRQLLTNKPNFVFFSCHTPGFTQKTMAHLMDEYFGDLPGSVVSGEMLIKGDQTLDLPSGTYGLWRGA